MSKHLKKPLPTLVVFYKKNLKKILNLPPTYNTKTTHFTNQLNTLFTPS